MRSRLCILLLGIAGLCGLPTRAAEPHIRGLWVWKRATVLAAPNGATALRDFATAQGVTEIYVSISRHDRLAEDAPLIALIDLLHQSHLRVEALLDSIDADEAGKPRDDFLELTRSIVRFNQARPHSAFDGIHLDVEPHQRPENKGPGNLRFLPGLIATFQGVRAIARPAHLTVNADIPNKLLKGDAAQRAALFSSVDRFTLMLYELSRPNDGQSHDAQVQKLQHFVGKYLSMAYDDFAAPQLARMAIGLRTPDYGERLPEMLQVVDTSGGANPHYLGWAWHCYNDRLPR
jgi:hypothetical protein